jgi:hypothetical protein
MSKEAMNLALEGAANYIDTLGGDSSRYRQTLANEALDCMAENARELGLHYDAKSDHKLMENAKGDVERIQLVQTNVGIGNTEQPFFKHSVEQPYNWSEWVCPDPRGYLMKCCDCGLVHEAEFGVVRYKSETEREDCDMVDDPNLQAVFRMRRSEQWSPADMAHRAGGLTMEQPAQQQLYCYVYKENGEEFFAPPTSYVPDDATPLYASPPAQRTWAGLTAEEIAQGNKESWVTEQAWQSAVWWAEAKLKEKNT